MTQVRKRRPRDPVATREVILKAAREVLAKDGPEGISVSSVAVLAGVNRGTAYQHFDTREALIAATTQSVSDLLFRATFGDPASTAERNVEEADVGLLTATLAEFAVDNPALCRIWFLQLLASDEPAQDPFWREFAGSFRRFTETDLAEPNVDTEVLSLMVLAGNFLWPVWTKAHEKTPEARRTLARRFSDECLRLSLFGTMKAEHFPELVEQLGSPEKAKAKAAAKDRLRAV
jgi:AcrR family transcriptional regulator